MTLRYQLRAACRVLPQTRLLLLIVLAAAPAHIARFGVPIGLEKGAEVVVTPDVAARNEIIGRGLARHKTALGTR